MPDPKDPKNGDPNGDPKPKPSAAGEKPGSKTEPLAYDTWIGEQPDEVKVLLTDHTSGLKTALESERGSRKDLEGKLRDLAEKAKGDQKEALKAMANDIKAADLKTDFFEDAHEAGVSNLKLAYQVALADDMFDRKGNVNFDTMKTGYPELFGGKPKAPKGGAGEGHDNDNNPSFDMNDAIRQKAGRI